MLTIVLVLMLTSISVPMFKRSSSKSAVDKEVRALQEEKAKAESKNSQLKQMVEYLETDSFLEEQARLNLNLKKEGETVVIVETPPTNTTSSTDNNSAKAKTGPSNLSKWVDYFFAAK